MFCLLVAAVRIVVVNAYRSHTGQEESRGVQMLTAAHFSQVPFTEEDLAFEFKALAVGWKRNSKRQEPKPIAKRHNTILSTASK